MMIDAPATAATLPAIEDGIDPSDAPRWQMLWEDARFFLLCYLAGLIAFFVMLS